MRDVIEFITVEKVIPTEINRLLRAVYLDDVVDRSTVSKWPTNIEKLIPLHDNAS